jgi:hypothetical protein
MKKLGWTVAAFTCAVIGGWGVHLGRTQAKEAEAVLTPDEALALKHIRESDALVEEMFQAQRGAHAAFRVLDKITPGPAKIVLKWHEADVEAWGKVNGRVAAFQRPSVCDEIHLQIIGDIGPSTPFFERLFEARGCGIPAGEAAHHPMPLPSAATKSHQKEPLHLQYPVHPEQGQPVVEFRQRGAGAVIAQGFAMPPRGEVVYYSVAGWLPQNRQMVRIDFSLDGPGYLDRTDIDWDPDAVFRVQVSAEQTRLVTWTIQSWSSKNCPSYTDQCAWVVDQVAQNLGLKTNPYTDRDNSARRPVSDVKFLKANNTATSALEAEKTDAARVAAVRTSENAWAARHPQQPTQISGTPGRDSGTGASSGLSPQPPTGVGSSTGGTGDKNRDDCPAGASCGYFGPLVYPVVIKK